MVIYCTVRRLSHLTNWDKWTPCVARVRQKTKTEDKNGMTCTFVDVILMSEKQCRFDTEEHPTLTCEGHMFQSMLNWTSEVPNSEVDTVYADVYAEKHIISLHCACNYAQSPFLLVWSLQRVVSSWCCHCDSFLFKVSVTFLSMRGLLTRTLSISLR